MKTVESQFHTSEKTICPICGEIVRWSITRLFDSEDDKFSGVIDKLKWHQENDKLCIREKKLKLLISE